tara:strand:+ start:184 stop:903 length:720 start_codon:yes stop_codon:yes gene_type:complete
VSEELPEDSEALRDFVRQFIMRSWDVVEPDDPAWAAKRELAEPMRRLAHLTVCSEAPAEVLQGAARAVRQALQEMEAYDARSFLQCYRDGDYLAKPHLFSDRAWITGPSNPLSPLMRLEAGADGAQGTVRLENGYVGAPGWVHGGMVAALMDQLMGFVLVSQGDPCVTQSLTMHYDRPTPSHEELFFRAWIEKDKGRQVHMHGEVKVGEEVTARSEAVFVRLEAKLFGRMLAEFAANNP